MIINTHTGKVQYTRAGHSPPAILRTDGSIEKPDAGGIPIGWDFDRDDPLVEFTLNKGDRVYLFSDGICEARNKKEDLFGEARLHEVLKRNLNNSLDETLNDTIRYLSKFTNTLNFEDDISILGVTYQG